MANTVAKSITCGACGAEARDGSLYCHKCGSEIAVEPLPPAIVKPSSGILNGRTERAEKTPFPLDPEPPPVMVPVEPMEHVSRPAVPGDTAQAAPKTRLERVRANKQPQKIVEVEWVERGGASVWYFVSAIVLAVAAALMIAAALYLH